ncbi:MAG: U32 family peptidase, partial [Aeromonas sp.]
ALISAPSELKELRRYADNGEFMLEANDFGAVQLAHEAGAPFVCGPAVNVYNAEVLQLLHGQGMRRWVMPVELSRAWLSQLSTDLGALRQQIEIEVFSYGHLPLAYSARCFTARARNVAKDQCELACLEHPQGLIAASREGQALFNLNGIQTQSAYRYHLGNDLAQMHELVDIVRLSPDSVATLDVLAQFKANQHGAAPFTLNTQPWCNGYWHQVEGMARVTA